MKATIHRFYRIHALTSNTAQITKLCHQLAHVGFVELAPPEHERHLRPFITTAGREALREYAVWCETRRAAENE